MTDESLRSLERVAKERPDDIAAGRALARAFARAGEVRREYLEWSRLARLGDSKARETVAWWSGQSGRRVRAPLPERLKTVRTRAPSEPGASRLVGSTRHFLVVAARDAVYLVDPVTLEEAARIPAPEGEHLLASVPCGDGILIARGRTLVLHDETGRAVAQARLPDSVYTLDVLGDRALVQSSLRSGGHQVSLIDVGEAFGDVLLTRTSADRHQRWPRFVDGGLLIHEESSALASLVDPAPGAAREAPLGSLDAVGDRFLVAEGNLLAEHEGSGGRRVWEAPGAPFSAEAALFVARDLALVRWAALGIRGALSGPLTVYARGDGRALWSVDLPHVGFFFVAGDAVVTVVGRPHLSIRILDLVSGRERARIDEDERLIAGAPLRGTFRPAPEWIYGVAGVVFVPGAIVVLGLAGDEPRLVRLE
jgi:hypothetical protein